MIGALAENRNVSSNTYLMCGLRFRSEIPLPELIPAEHNSQPDVRIREGVKLRGRPDATPNLIWELPDGRRWLESFKNDSGYQLIFPGYAEFQVNHDGTDIALASMPGTRPDTSRHLLLDQVIPLVLSLRGHHVLHASAVATDAGVCAFAAPTGSGKSTLALSLVRAGHRLISDDCLLIAEDNGQFAPIPAYPGVRVWSDSAEQLVDDNSELHPVAHYTSKLRMPLGASDDFHSVSPLLASIYILKRDTSLVGAPQIEDLDGAQAMIEVVGISMLLDPTDRAMISRQFDFLVRLVRSVPVRRLTIPNDFSALPEVERAILSQLSSQSASI